MDARLGILIEESYDAADAAWDKHEKKLHRGLADIGTAHSKITKGMSRDYDMYAAAAMSKVKTVEEYRQDWAGKSTKKLVEYEKELSNERTNLINKLKLNYAEVDTVQTRIHKNRLEQASAELRALKQVSAERKEVQFGGAGALISQLGAGRVTSIFSPLSGIGEMSGGAAAATGIGVGIGAAAAAGAAGVEIFKKMETAAKSYEDGQDRLAIALRRSGEAGAQLRAELAIDSKVVDDLAIEMAKPRAEVAETMGSIAAYSKESGLQLKRTTELVMAIAESTGMEMTRVARMVGKGMNPEVMSDMERLGVHVDKDATQIERLDALEKQYGSTVEGLRDQMQQGEHGWERLKNQLDITIDRFSDKAFDRLTPVFKNLAPEVDRFGDALNNLDLDGFIHRVGNVVHVMEWMIGKTDEQENARREFEARAKNIPYQTVETERKNRKQNNSDEDVLAARAANLGSAPDIPTLTGSYLSDYKKGKGGSKSDSITALKETVEAKKWLADQEAKTNKDQRKKEYDSEISFQQQEQLNFAAMTEVQVDDTREAQRIIYEEKKKRLESERDVAKFMYKENTELYDGFTKELSQLDFERSVQLAKNRKEDEKADVENAKKTLEINKELRDKIIALDTNEKEKLRLQETARYADEYDKIQKETADEDTKVKQLTALNEEHVRKLAEITAEAGKKAGDPLDKVLEKMKAINGEFAKGSDEAKNWGETLAPMIEYVIGKLTGNSSKSGLPTYLSNMLPAGMMPVHQDSGPLSKDGIPMGDGTFLIRGIGQDRLLKDNPFDQFSYHSKLSLPSKPQGSESSHVDTNYRRRTAARDLADRETEERENKLLEAVSGISGTPNVPEWVPLVGQAGRGANFKYVIAHPNMFSKEDIAIAKRGLRKAQIGMAVSAVTYPIAGMTPLTGAAEHVAEQAFTNEAASWGAGFIAEHGVHAAIHKGMEASILGMIPSVHDSPPFGQIGKKIVAGDSDDVLVKGGMLSQLPGMLKEAVKGGISESASKVTGAASKVGDNSTEAGFLNMVGPLAGSLGAGMSGTGIGFLDRKMKPNKGLQQFGSAFSSFAGLATSGASHQQAMGSLMGNMLGDFAGTSKNASSVLGTLSSLAPVAGLIPGVGGISTMLGFGSQIVNALSKRPAPFVLDQNLQRISADQSLQLERNTS